LTDSLPKGAPVGNENAKKPRIWSDALRKYAVQNPQTVDKAAKIMWENAALGDTQAAKEIADRLEGRPVQAVEQKTELSGSVETNVNIRPQLTKEEWLKAHGLGTASGAAE